MVLTLIHNLYSYLFPELDVSISYMFLFAFNRFGQAQILTQGLALGVELLLLPIKISWEILFS